MSFLNSKNSMVIGVLAAVGASACCLGPLFLLTIGIGGTWVGSLTALEPYQPFFIGLSVLAFGLAYCRLYLVDQACTPGAACAEPAISQRQRLMFWIAAILALCLLAVPLAAPLFM